MSRIGLALIPLALAAGVLPAQTSTPPSDLKLRSGGIEYRLARSGSEARLAYFGPEGMAAWDKPHGAALAGDLQGRIENQPISAASMALVSSHSRTVSSGVDELELTYRHRTLPFELHAVYDAWGDTGVFTRRLLLVNTGQRPITVNSMASLAWQLPPGEYRLDSLWGGWGQERQLRSEKLGPGTRAFSSARGRSTELYSPWFALFNDTLGAGYAAQLAWSGNWAMSFERAPGSAFASIEESPLNVVLRVQFDSDGALALQPGVPFQLPEVAFTATALARTAGDLDDLANRLHRYQRQYVIAHNPANTPPLVQFNSWYPYQGKVNVEELKRCADSAASLGAEAFVLDAGWYNKKDWSRELGDYEADKTAFPHGIEELAAHVRERGMKFGLWTEIENVGVDSDTFHRHPEWCLQYQSKPILGGPRCQLNFALPEVRAWANSVVDRLVRDYRLEWIKIDYNIGIGSDFDAAPGLKGAVLASHIVHYYAWLDALRQRHPQLVVENCSSGGLRFDLGIVRHTNTTWLSDMVAPLPSLQLGYSCTLQFAPEVCNHWMVGDDDIGHVDLSKPAGWWDFMLRVPMNGQFGISSRVFEWSPELLDHARRNVQLYKRIRAVIQSADVYHLTPQPDHNQPEGWMAIEYATADAGRAVLMAYRLQHGEETRTFQLRGLHPQAEYEVSQDGAALGVYKGADLAARGLTVKLPDEWRAAVIELHSK